MKVRYTCICCLNCVRYTSSGLLRSCGLAYSYQSIFRVRRSLFLRCVTLKMKVLPFTSRRHASPQRFCLRQRRYENLTSCIGWEYDPKYQIVAIFKEVLGCARVHPAHPLRTPMLVTVFYLQPYPYLRTLYGRSAQPAARGRRGELRKRLLNVYLANPRQNDWAVLKTYELFVNPYRTNVENRVSS